VFVRLLFAVIISDLGRSLNRLFFSYTKKHKYTDKLSKQQKTTLNIKRLFDQELSVCVVVLSPIISYRIKKQEQQHQPEQAMKTLINNTE